MLKYPSDNVDIIETEEDELYYPKFGNEWEI